MLALRRLLERAPIGMTRDTREVSPPPRSQALSWASVDDENFTNAPISPLPPAYWRALLVDPPQNDRLTKASFELTVDAIEAIRNIYSEQSVIDQS